MKGQAKTVQAKTVQAKTVQVGQTATSPALHDPLARRRVALMLLMSYVLLVGAGTGVGLLLRGPLEDTALARMDRFDLRRRYRNRGLSPHVSWRTTSLTWWPAWCSVSFASPSPQ